MNRIFNTSDVFKWFTIQYSNSFHSGIVRNRIRSVRLSKIVQMPNDEEDNGQMSYKTLIKWRCLKNISQLSITCYLATSSIELARRLITHQRSVSLEINKFRTYYLTRLEKEKEKGKRKGGREAAKSNQYLFPIWSSMLIEPVNLAINRHFPLTLPRPKEAKRGEEREASLSMNERREREAGGQVSILLGSQLVFNSLICSSPRFHGAGNQPRS